MILKEYLNIIIDLRDKDDMNYYKVIIGSVRGEKLLRIHYRYTGSDKINSRC